MHQIKMLACLLSYS